MNKYAASILLACLLVGSASAAEAGSLRKLQEEDTTAPPEESEPTEPTESTDPTESTETTNPAAGRAISLWWVIFNEPDSCLTSPDEAPQCSDLDVLGPAFRESMAKGAPDLESIAANEEAKMAILHGAGGITDADGNLVLAATIYASPEPLELSSGLDVNLWGRGLLDSKNSEVHVVLRDHGPADEEGFGAQMTSYFEPYCDDLLFGVTGDFSNGNTCEDAQIAQFPANSEGTLPMNWYTIGSPDYTPIDGTTVSLTRDGSALTTVVKTTFVRA